MCCCKLIWEAVCSVPLDVALIQLYRSKVGKEFVTVRIIESPRLEKDL